MRILFLTKYPPTQASSRYCVYQYLPYFESQGVECVGSPFYDADSYAQIFGSGSFLRKCLLFVRCLLIRMRWLFSLGQFDMVVSHRECVPIGPVLFERVVRWRKKPFVFIYDDALFVFKPSTRNRLYDLFKSPRKFYTIFKQANLVIGANDYLAQVPRDAGANAKTLRIGEDLDRYTCPDVGQNQSEKTSSDDQSICIGWIGSPSTEKYLSLIRDPLNAIGRRFPGTRLLVIGGGKFQLDDMPVEHAAWSAATEVSNLHRIDIGLMPLPDEQWSLGKSGGKARLYMAVGIVPVVTDIGFNRDLIDDYSTGRLVGSIDQWEHAIAELIENCQLRHSISRQARATIEAHYSVTVTGKQYLDMLCETAGISLDRQKAAPSPAS